MHGQRTDTDYRGERAGTRKTALGQPGLGHDARHGSTVIGARLDHDVRAVDQPETEHHRHLLQLEQHVDGFAAQMVPTPARQPVGQIVQRHVENFATARNLPVVGTSRTARGAPRRED